MSPLALSPKTRRPLAARSASRTAAAILATVLLGWSCRTTATPARSPAAPTEARIPVILVPGISGVSLLDPATGELAWGDGKRLLVPKDGGWGLALPLVEDRESPLLPGRVIREMRIGPVRKPVYQPVLEALVDAGYRLGNLDDPAPDETLFPFAYDWRRSNVDSANALARALADLRAARGDEEMQVDLICQSNGTYVCRWFAKYGDATLETAANGQRLVAEGITVRRIVLAGTANGGAARMFRELTRGRRYVPFGRWMREETLFTFPSFFQDLPVADRMLFVDRRGRELELSLDEPDDWRRGRWSIFSRPSRRRIAGSAGGRQIFGSDADRRRHLEEQLGRARLFHARLRDDVEGYGVERICSIQSRTRPTPIGALVEGTGDETRLIFAGDRTLARFPEAAVRITARGDLHATVASQELVSPQEREVLEDTAWVDGDHFELILDPASLRTMVDCFRD